MVYQWKLPGLYKIPAQKAGETLEELSKTKPLTPDNVLDVARAEENILHECFDWHDSTAAESYRRIQAQKIIQNLVTISIEQVELPTPVRAFVHIDHYYEPMSEVVKTTVLKNEMLADALAELKIFKTKYMLLTELYDLFSAIEKEVEKIA